MSAYITSRIIKALVDNNIIDDNEDKKQAVTNILEEEFEDTIFTTWNADDVRTKAGKMDVEINEDQVGNVLCYLEHHWDASVGICWDTVKDAIHREMS